MFRTVLLCLFLLSGATPVMIRADCGPEIPGADALLYPGSLVLLGEVHGTREIPRVFGDLACKAAEMGIPVRTGLELPVVENKLMDEWFRGTDEEEKLWASPFFAKSYQDGRSSRAMGEMLLRFRALKRLGKDIEPFFFDPAVRANRDQGMAKHIAAVVREQPEAVILILAGNLHAQKTKGSPFSKTFVPMGYFLTSEGFSPVSTKFLTSKGSTWICNGGTADSCGIRNIGGKDLGDPPILNLGKGKMPRGYDGTLFVGPATASLPFHGANGE